MTKKKLKVGIVGIGKKGDKATTRRALAYIDLFNQDERTKVEAICDIHEEALEEISRKFNIPKTFLKYENMIEEELDIVVITTPPTLHASMAIKALKSGKNVLSEVPFFYNF